MAQGPIPVRTVADGTVTRLNITAATVVKATPGRVARISVIVPGSTAGTVNDVATTAGAAVGNQVFTIPDTAGVYPLDWPCAVGIVVVPGTAQTVSVLFT